MINNDSQVVGGADVVEGLRRACLQNPEIGQMPDLGALGREMNSAWGKAVPQDGDG